MQTRAGQEYFVFKCIYTYVQVVKHLECTQVHFWEISVLVLVLKYISNALRFSSTFRVNLSTFGFSTALFS